MADSKSKQDKQDDADEESVKKSVSEKPAKAEKRAESPSEGADPDDDERDDDDPVDNEPDESADDEDDDDQDEKPKAAKKAASKPASKEPVKAAKSDKSKEPAKKSGSGGGGGGGKKPPPVVGPKGDNIRVDDLAPGVMKIMAGVGLVALVASVGLGMSGDNMKRFMHSYLVAFMFTLSIALGALWWVTLQHLVNARWSIVVRRVGELLASGMPVVALLSLPLVVPVLMGKDLLYPWANYEFLHHGPMEHKAPYFGLGFYVVRIAIYFGFWTLLSHFFLKRSLAQDEAVKGDILPKVRSISAPSMIAVALTLTFAAVDFLMSLDPMWFSTIFGVYYFAGCVIAVHATMALSLMWLQSKGRMQKSVTTEHFHDLGKMLFAFTVFWAYIGFSQFMLIWYANVPEETVFYKERFAGDWATVSALLLFCHFAIPFFGLLSRHVKRHRTGLAIWAVWMLVMHYVDMYWLVMPRISHEHVAFHVLDVTCLVALVCLFLAGVAYRAGKVNLIAVKDPRLAKSLAFEQF